MNLSVKGFGMFGGAASGLSFGGRLPGMRDMTLKSTQEAAQRAQKAAGQIDFWEERKAGLRNRECGSVEEIADKLDMLHTYEDEITAAKMAYNHEQMFHLMDEAKERGEKIAEAVEEMEPKTPEERREELAEEALGTKDGDGMVEEIMEEAEEILEETEEIPQEAEEMLEEAEEIPEEAEEMLEETEEVPDEMEEMLKEAEEVPDEIQKEIPEEIVAMSGREIQAERLEEAAAAERTKASAVKESEILAAVRDGEVRYRPFDRRI